ncbi:RDD family protein [Nocardioides campestrisoli]|uniref:RDD family protein n=1 Tax=Nocardioides campestrisoli TaxID=2736757 RepID=UPI00163DD562|nr:RDD family protein [Nocardioides campestrisoli]
MTQLPITFPVADLERRFLAFVLDRAVTWPLYAAAAAGGWLVWGRDGLWATAGIVLVLALLVVVVLGAVTGVKGTTPGKRATSLRVVHHGTGMPIGVGPGILRSLVQGLLTLPTFGFGLAALAWTALADSRGQRRGWHDHLAGSVVVDLRPEQEEVAEEAEGPRHVVNLTAMRLVPAPAQPAPVVERPVRRPAPVAPTPEAPSPPPSPATAPAPAPTPVPVPAAPAAEDGRTVARSAPRHAAAPTAPRWRVFFDTGETFPVEGLVLVGRRPEPRPGEQVRHVVALPSSDMSLSKTHAQFGPAPDGSLVVMDRGSTNGSMLLRQGVVRELGAGKPATLLPGDRVRFGDREMSVQRDTPA